MKINSVNRYESIGKRNFRSAIIRLLETEYKLVGSHRVIAMIAEDIYKLHQEFYPDIDEKRLGHIVWRTTGVTSKKPSYGTKVEDYEVKTVILPLISETDVEMRINHFYGHAKKNENYKKQQDRDIEVMARLVKSAYQQGGLLSGAELSVLLNRALGTIGKYMRIYHERNDDILPTKGMVLDQGSKPTHKAAIINLYEQGYPEVDIARLTDHQIESTSRYIKSYKRIKLLMEKGFSLIDMVRVTGMGRSTIIQYKDLVCQYHPRLRPKPSTNPDQNLPPKGRAQKKRKKIHDNFETHN
jgi:hypothetical protein